MKITLPWFDSKFKFVYMGKTNLHKVNENTVKYIILWKSINDEHLILRLDEQDFNERLDHVRQEEIFRKPHSLHTWHIQAFTYEKESYKFDAHAQNLQQSTYFLSLSFG